MLKRSDKTRLLKSITYPKITGQVSSKTSRAHGEDPQWQRQDFIGFQGKRLATK